MKQLAVWVFCVAALSCTKKEVSAEKPQPPPPPQVTPAAPEAAKPSADSPTDDVSKGKAVFAAKGCTACHTVGEGVKIGPDLKGVTARRDEKWISRMILEPEVMLKEDDVARRMMEETYVAMPNQGVDAQTELPFLLSYLKSAEK